MRHINTTGIILKKHKSGEYDQFITLYSPMLGKVEAFAKGSRKMESVFTGHLETLNICKLQLYKSAHSFTITQCQTEITFKNIWNELPKTVIAYLVIEIFQRITYSSDNGQALFDLVQNTLHQIDNSNKHLLSLENFKIKLLNLLGMMPDVSRCGSCQKKWTKEKTISLDNAGHLSCFDCLRDKTSYQEVPFNIMKLVHFMTHQDITEGVKIKLTMLEEEALKKISNTFLDNYLDREIKSEKFFTICGGHSTTLSTS